MPVDALAYREAMSRLGAAVNIITTGDTEARHGFTASAVCSVTDDPPTLLVCMNRSSRSRNEFKVGGPVCVNTLAADQKDISAAFASRSEMTERFTGGNWTTLVTGAPVLEEAIVACDCLVSNIVEVGTHSVIFCAVQAVRLGSPREALMYYGRAYHGLPHPPM